MPHAGSSKRNDISHEEEHESKAAGEFSMDTKQRDEKIKKAPISNFWRILSFGDRTNHLVLLLALVAAVASGVELPLSNIIFGRLAGQFNEYFIPGTIVTEKQFKHSVSQNALFFVYLFVAKFVLTYIASFCFRSTGLRISAGLRLGYLTALLAQPISKLDQVSAGTVSNTITSSANAIQASVSDRLSLLFSGLALLISAYAIAFRYNWLLTLVTSSAVLFMILLYSFTTPPAVKIQQSIDKADAKHASIAGEIFGAIRTVASLGAEASLSQKYFTWVEESKRRGLKSAPQMGGQLGPIFFTIYASFSLAFWFGLKLYRAGHIQLNDVIVVIFSVLIVVSDLGSIVQPLMLIVKGISASSEFFDMIDAETIGKEGMKAPEVSAQADIVFDNVDFCYPTRREVQVLKGFSATFKKGMTTALVGPSGSGKSTIVALLERWYEVGCDANKASEDAGTTNPLEKRRSADGVLAETDPQRRSNGNTILCDGLNVNDFDLKWWRTQIGLVQQEPFLFNDTIFKNVSSGLLGTEWEDANDNQKLELVQKACQEAFADEFINRLPDQYNTMVGESGIKLSGGQRQRIAIARSIVRQPKILILDEATSSIDVRSERIVQDALDKVSKDRTTIVIAHRLATIRKADHIVVLRHGRKVEEGTHDELIAKDDGLYQGLVHAQQLESGLRAEDPDLEASVTPVRSKSANEETIVDEEQGEAGKNDPYKRKGFFASVGQLLYEQKRYWPLYGVALVGIIGAGTAFSLQSWFFAKIVQVFQFTGHQLVHEGNFWSLMFFVLALAMGISYLTIGFASTSISTYVGYECRKSYFLDILRQPIPFFDAEGNSSGGLMSRLSTDPKNLQELLGMTGAFPTISVFNLIGCIAVSFSFGWKLALVAVFSAMPVILVTQFLRLRYEVHFDKTNAAVFAESSTFATEAISAMRTVVSLTMEDTIIKRYKDMLEVQIRESIRKASYNMLVLAFADSVGLLCMALTFWYGGQLLATHEYGPVQFFVVYVAIVQGSQGAGPFFAVAPNLAQATASANRILGLRLPSTSTELTEDDSFHPQNPTSPAGPDSNAAHIRIENLSFRYPTRNTPLFNHLSLTIPAGHFAAFVGPSGCGKTTIISLLERFYDPISGTISLNGTDVRTILLKPYRRNLSLVAQEPRLFQGTIRENLVLGLDPPSTDDDDDSSIHAACRAAEIHDFIASLPDGYGTEILSLNTSSTATALSGGQKQRLCLARALLRRPALLLLDEATSSLDSQSEALVQAAIERLASDRAMTVVAVAHRLATVQKADVIFVFGEDGSTSSERGGSRIVEQGTHHELLRKRGVYWGMCQAQALDR